MVPFHNAEDREKVQTCFGINLVVEAGAGTGKTSSLIKRICVAVLAKDIAVEKIVALTFTEKAAAEIKNRLVSSLHQVARDIRTEQETGVAADEKTLLHLLRTEFGLKEPDILSRVQRVLDRLDRASVGTIHGFCADILKTFPLEAGLSPQAEIDAGPKAARLFQARWNAFLDEELGPQAARANLWKEVLPEISLEELNRFAQTLCSGQIEQYDYFSHADMLAPICEEKSAQAGAWTRAYLPPKKSAPRNIEKALAWAQQSLLRSAAFLRQTPLPPPPQEPLPALPAKAPSGWEEDAFEQACSLIKFAVRMQPEKQRIFRQALELVQPVTRQIRDDFAREGILSFDDLIVKTRNLVQQDLYVRRLLKEKFDMLFIDEFQDTDPVQGELLLFLAEEKSSAAARWQDVRLAPGKLFVVGDPKQSIYRFRGADITAYELFTQLILSQGGEKCFLRSNFRSTPEIVAYANAVCRQAMIQQTSFQPAYESIFTDNPPLPGSVQWLFVTAPADGARADDFRANQGERIADWISANVGRLTRPNGEKLAYKDIVILSRAGTTAGPYTEALRRRGIPFNADGEKDFFKRQEINDLLNFLRVVADPSDTTALVGVLRSPLGGFTDEEIYQLATRGELSVYAASRDPALVRLYQLLQTFIQKVGRMDVQNLLEEILDTTFLPEACAGAYEGEKSVEILTQLVRSVPQITAGAPVSLGQFLTAVQAVVDETPEQLSALSPQTADAVSVMTVHKSKGLERPVVILADLSKKEASSPAKDSTQHIFSWQYNMHGLCAGKISDANLTFLKEEQKKHERCEEVRILYVALTRAKEKLLLVADGRKGAPQAARAFAQVGLFPDGTSTQLGGDEVLVPVQYAPYQDPAGFVYRPQSSTGAATAQEELARWKQLAQTRQQHYDALLAEQHKAPSALVEESAVLTPAQQDAARLGSICHGALHRLLGEPGVTLDTAVNQSAGQAGCPERAPEAAAILEPFCHSALFAQLKTSTFLAGEMPFSYLADNGLVESGVMDGVLEQPDGSIWVVDYKTDKIPARGIAELVEKYRPQLTVYKQAAQKLFPGRTVKCLAVFVRTCESAEV